MGTTRPDQCFHLGVMLFKLNALEASEHTLKRGIAIDKQADRVAQALRHLSAIASTIGNPTDARAFIQKAAMLSPFEMPRRFDLRKPTVLRIREVDNSRYTIKRHKRTGLNRKLLKGGHFSPRYLIGKDFNIIVLNATAKSVPDVRSLPPIDLIINSVACPDLSGGSLRHITKIIDLLPGVEVVNSPGEVLKTSRDNNAERLGALKGVTFPLTSRVQNQGSVSETAAMIEKLELGFPLIIRVPGKQTGRTVDKIEGREQLIAYLENSKSAGQYYVIKYIDCRGKDGYFHKTRCFFIDGKFYPVAHLSSDDWQIHSGDRYKVMSKSNDLQRLEMNYLFSPTNTLGAQAMEGLKEIARTLNLDFFGIDFTVLPNNELVVFEANPAMRHNFDHAANFPYTRPYLETISRAFQNMMKRKSRRDLQAKSSCSSKSSS